MNWFRRLCLFLFGLAGLLALVALCLPWVGPYQEEARALIYTEWYFYALEGCVCVAGVGCLVGLLRSLFSPRNPKSVIISRLDGGIITVTRAAIASQTEHIVEDDGTLVASSVRVNAKKRGHIRVTVKVTPKRPVDVVQVGEGLHRELRDGLAKICGDKLESVSLEFTDAEQPQEAEGDITYSAPYVSPYASEDGQTAGSPEATQLPDSAPETGITVPMSSFSRHEEDVSVPDGEAATEATPQGEPAPQTEAGEAQEPAADVTAPDALPPEEDHTPATTNAQEE